MNTEKILELKNNSAKLVNDARAILDKGITEKRATTNEEMATADKMFDDAKMFRKTAERLEQVDALEAENNKAEDRKVVLPVGEKKSLLESDEYRKAFFNLFVQKGNPEELRALQADSVTGGGYTIPDGFVNELIVGLHDEVSMRAMARVIPLKKAVSLGVPYLDNNPADIEWAGEISEVAEDTTMSFGKREFKPHMLPKLIKISRTLIENSPMVDAAVKSEFLIKFGQTEENAFMNGHGAGQPLGVFTVNDNGIGSSRDISTGNTTTAFTANGLKNCKYNLKPQYRKHAKWIFHTDAVKMLDTLKDGENRYIWQPSLSAGKPETLLGYPIVESVYAPNTFTTGLNVGILGDFRYYWIADALNFSLQVLYEKYATKNLIGYIFRKSTDGMPVLADPFSRVKLL